MDEELECMDLDELDEAQRDTVRRIIQQDPMFAIRAAASIGWGLRPPGEKNWVTL